MKLTPVARPKIAEVALVIADANADLWIEDDKDDIIGDIEEESEVKND